MTGRPHAAELPGLGISPIWSTGGPVKESIRGRTGKGEHHEGAGVGQPRIHDRYVVGLETLRAFAGICRRCVFF